MALWIPKKKKKRLIKSAKNKRKRVNLSNESRRQIFNEMIEGDELQSISVCVSDSLTECPSYGT